MATDLARLAIRVESLEADKASARLDRLAKKGRKAETATDGLSKAAKRLGATLGSLYAVTKVAGAFAEAAKVQIKFEASISELSAITGAAGDDLKFLSDQAKFLGRTTTLSASQVAEGFKLVASAKPDLLESGEALAKVTKSAITLAEATGSTMPEAADTLGRALNQFGAGAEEADRYINVLAAGAQRGASFVNETAEALKFAGTVANTVGVSFEGVNAAIQNLSTVGIKGSEAGTALRNTYLKLEGQMNSQFKPSIVGQTQALKNLRDANMSTTELVELFGLRSVVAANQIIQQADAVEELEGKLTGTNTAFEQQKIKIDNLEGSMKQMDSATEGLQVRIGEAMNPTLRALVDTVTDATNAFTDYLGESDDANAITGVLDGTLRLLIRTVFNIGIAFREAGEIIGTVMAHFANGAGTVADVFGGLGRVVGSVFSEIGVRVNQGVVIFLDFADELLAFGKKVYAALTFDFDMFEGVTRAREESAKAADAELKALGDRAKAIRADRDAAIDAIGSDIAARSAQSDAIDADFVARRKETLEEINLFYARTAAGYESVEAREAAAELSAKEIADAERKLELEKAIAEAARVEDNQTALDDVSDKFRTDIEAAEDAAAEQLAILNELGLASNKLTAAQEAQRVETIKRIHAELEDFRNEQIEKESDAAEKKMQAELAAEEKRQATLLEFRLLGEENEVERAQIIHEARMEAIAQRGEDELVARELIDKALEAQEKKHQENIEKLKADQGRKQNKFDEFLAKSKTKSTLQEVERLTAGLAQHSKTAFNLNKAAGIANAIINTYEGVTAALALGPPQSFILAPMQLAAGLAQVAAIKSTSFEGGGGGTTPSLNGSTPTYNGQPVGNDSGANDDLLNPPTSNIDGSESRTQIIVSGNVGFTPTIIDEIAEGLREATGERDVVIFDEGSRQAQDIVGVSYGAG